MAESAFTRGQILAKVPIFSELAENELGFLAQRASPLLANVYLHYVFDLWVEVWRKRVAKGDVIVVR